MGKKQHKKDQHKKAAAAEPADEGKGADKRKGSAKQQVRPADCNPPPVALPSLCPLLLLLVPCVSSGFFL
jgi:hypothetical protein